MRNGTGRRPSSSGHAPPGSRALTEQLAAGYHRTHTDDLLARWDEHREEREALDQWQARGGTRDDFFQAWDEDSESVRAHLDAGGPAWEYRRGPSGPRLCPSGLWEVRHADGVGYFADFERAQERADEARWAARR
jgi:hypothetical protein